MLTDEPVLSPEPVAASPQPASTPETEPDPTPAPEPQSAVPVLQNNLTPETSTESLPPFILPPTPDLDKSGPMRMVTVILRATGDKSRDQLRIRRIHGIITSYPGNDRFAFHIFERGKGYLLEFPNLTTGVCQEMINRLSGLVGIENIRVDQITFQ